MMLVIILVYLQLLIMKKKKIHSLNVFNDLSMMIVLTNAI